MRRILIKCFTLLVLLFILSRCASIIHGSNQNVVIVSDPKKANLEIDGQNVGETPYVARLMRRNRHFVKVQLNGYIPYEITLKRKLDGWAFGNVIFGGLIGIGVDFMTGSIYRLTPKDISADLKSTSASFHETKNQLYLVVVLKHNNNWQKIGQLEKFTLP